MALVSLWGLGLVISWGEVLGGFGNFFQNLILKMKIANAIFIFKNENEKAESSLFIYVLSLFHRLLTFKQN